MFEGKYLLRYDGEIFGLDDDLGVHVFHLALHQPRELLGFEHGHLQLVMPLHAGDHHALDGAVG